MIVLTHDGTIVNLDHVSSVAVQTHDEKGSFVGAWEAGVSDNPWRLTPYITDRYAEYLLHDMYRLWRDGHPSISFESINPGDDLPEDDGV